MRRVVDRNRGAAHEDDEIVVRGETGGDAVDVATKNLRGVGQGLTAGELQLVRAEKGRVPAKLLHAGLKGVAGAGAGMLKEHAQRLPGKVWMRLRPLPLDLEPERGFDQGIDIGARQVKVGEDAAAVQTGSSEARGGVIDPGENLTACPGCVVAVDERLHRFCTP